MAKKKVKKEDTKDKETGKNRRTIYDDITDAVDAAYDEDIKSGRMFKRNIDDITRMMDAERKLDFFKRIDSINISELLEDHSLDPILINNWFKEYKNYAIILRASNNQLTYKSTTTVQIALFHYLIRLKVVNLDILREYLENETSQAELLSHLFNRDKDNIRKALREVGIPRENKYKSEVNLNKLIDIAQDIEFKELEEEIKKDLTQIQAKKDKAKKI
jgi:hypothetical protein